MLILVTGGRDYEDYQTVDWALGQIEEYLLERRMKLTGIIHGDARGADSLADLYAQKAGILQIRCPGNSSYYGPTAFGPVRNKQMLALQPWLVVAFPGGNGTANMIKTAEKQGFRVWRPLGEVSIWNFMRPYTIFDEGGN